LPDEAGPRALLKARLAGPVADHETARPWFPVSMRAGVLGVCAVLVAGAVALGGRLWLKSREAAVIPLARLTPGATLPATRDTVCRVDASPAATLIPAAVRQAVLDRYGSAMRGLTPTRSTTSSHRNWGVQTTCAISGRSPIRTRFGMLR
jgi:hypothetical protein